MPDGARSPAVLEDARSKALAIHARLVRQYGPRRTRHRALDPLSELVLTILSQNTSDANTSRSYESLRSRYPTWEDVRRADVDDVADAIRIGGLAAIKAPRIISVLDRIEEERGELSLDFLEDKPIDEAKHWLTSLKGVGPKTAACVLLFSLGKPALPVDTHVHRVTARLGLIPANSTPEKANQLLEDTVPQDLYYPFHMNIIAHGRQVCKAQRPKCYACVLTDLCTYERKNLVPPD